VFRVGRGGADPMEASLPFSLLDQALAGLGTRVMFDAGESDRGTADVRARGFYSLLRWFERAAPRPLLLALDDLHWADPDSLALLLFLCRRVRRLPVAVLGTLRPWPSAANEVCARLARAGQARVERLAPLSDKGSGSLLAARLGYPLPDPEVRRSARLCAGNPLLLEQVAESVQRGESPGTLDAGAGEVSRSLLLTRFAGLPDAALRCVRAGSVLGTRFEPEVALEMSGLADVEVDPALEALQGSGLVRQLSGDWVEFVHPLFRQALYDDLAAARRARAHAEAFACLVRRGRDAEAAEHASRSGLVDSDLARAVLERAGRAALRVGALMSAVTHLTAAVDLAAGHATPDLLLALGEALVAAGRLAEAIAVLERIRDAEGAPAHARVQALRLMARCHYGLGATDQASLAFTTARDLAAAVGPATEVPVLLDHALACWITSGPAAALPLATRACAVTGVSESIARRARAVSGFIRLLAGDPSRLGDLAAAAQAVQSGPLCDLTELSYTWSAVSGHALAAAFTERFDEAERAFHAGRDVAERIGAVEAVASLQLGYTYATLLRLGRLQQALEVLDRVSDLAEVVPLVELPAAFAHAYVLLMMGRLEESDTWYRRGETAAGTSPDWWPVQWGWHVRGMRCLREGRLDEAAEYYLRIEAETARQGIQEPCALPWARHAMAVHVRCGRVADAVRVVEWLERCAAGLPCRWPRIAAATGRGWLAELRGDHAQAQACFDVALAHQDQARLPLERVETLVAYGSFMRRAGRTVRARYLLREALDLGEQIGAQWLAQQAREELAVAGGRRRRRDERPALTAQEQRVADLAGTGLRNQDIARQLCISTKTVEYHLQQVYAKLGIHSRRHLIAMHVRRAHQLGTDPETR
jgi:DNA-binding NarL/FixJ family response regulator